MRLNPDYLEARHNLANALISTDRAQEGMSNLTEIVLKNPNFVEGRYSLGLAHLQAGRVDESIREFEEALRLKPGFQPAQIGLERAKARKAAGGK